MSDYCNLCDTRRPEGGTNHLVLGECWIEFCRECGERETLTNANTGEVATVREVFDRCQAERAEQPEGDEAKRLCEAVDNNLRAEHERHAEAEAKDARDTVSENLTDRPLVQSLDIPSLGDDDEPDDEPWDGFRDDVEADADALASAGYGTDEDYGYFGGDEDFY